MMLRSAAGLASCAILWLGLWIAAMPGGQLVLLYRRNLLSPGLMLCVLLYLVAFSLFGARLNQDQQARKRPSVKRLLLFGLPAFT